MDKLVESSEGSAPAEAPAKPAARVVRLRLSRSSLPRRLLRSPHVQGAAAGLFANYLRFVHLTSRLAFDPPEPYGKYIHLAPVIITFWHGQHFMVPFARIFDFDVRVLISRHSDGEINARVAEKLGIRTIRGARYGAGGKAADGSGRSERTASSTVGKTRMTWSIAVI